MNIRTCGTIILFTVLIGHTDCNSQTSTPQQTSPIYIGILDDARQEMVNWKPEVAPDRVVRPAFLKLNGEWMEVNPKIFPSYVSWIVGFDGKNIGKIESHLFDKNGWSTAMDHLTFTHVITTPPSSIPSIGVPQERYAPLGLGPTKGRRPLVLVSKPYIEDPDGWKRIEQLPSAIESAVRTTFRGQFPHVSRCKDEVIVQHDWHFPDSALRFISIYASNKGSYLIQADLNAGDCGYVDDPDDPLANPWFYVSANSETRRIGAFMSLLDVGDYDNDGRSEIIFMLEQPEDEEGFILFDAYMHKRASLSWTYH